MGLVHLVDIQSTMCSATWQRQRVPVVAIAAVIALALVAGIHTGRNDMQDFALRDALRTLW
jgi:hypothetical protein